MAADPLLLAGLLVVHGSLWTLGHCAGMCGPLVAGLPLGRPGQAGALDLVAYQGGKAVTYAVLGGIAGGLGGGVEAALGRWSPWILGGLALVMLVVGTLRSASPFLPVIALARHLTPGQPGPRRAATLGLALALLPCGVVLWALGLAAVSASPVVGAGLMVLLCLITTPILVTLHLLGSPLQRRPWLARALPFIGAATLAAAAWDAAFRTGCAT